VMKILLIAIGTVLLLAGCKAATNEETATQVATGTESTATVSATTDTSATNTSATSTSADENVVEGTWAGQVKVAQPVSMFNYVGAESGDFAPMRFRNDSEAGQKILGACANDDECEFVGTVRWLDEVPPADASAIGEIVSVASVKRVQPQR